MKFSRLATTTSLVLIATVITLSQFTQSGFATPTPPTGQALEIAPPVLNLSGDPGAIVKSEVKLRNVSNGTMIVTTDINDFTANNTTESGDPKIIIDNKEPNPYSMTNWFEPYSQLTLKSKQMVTLPVTIKIPRTAAPGGYFAALRFTGRPAELDSTGVSLSASIASLALLKVNGGAKEAISIEDFTAKQNAITGNIFESTPLQFNERIKNNGNIHEQPTGLITIKDMFGKVVTNLSVNADQHNILPQSIRKFEQPLDSQAIGSRVLFGHYTADLTITYGANKTALTKHIDFWIIPYRIIGLIILALVAAFFALRFLIRRYNRAIVAKAQDTTKKTKK